MSQAGHIGLVAVGGPGWMGGVNYVRHLAAAVAAAAPGHRVSFVCGDAILPHWREASPLVRVATKPSFLSKITGQSAERLRRPLARAGIDFLYPLTYDNSYNLGLDFPVGRQLGSASWAGWIPDFQHRYLPELFSPEERERRDINIERLAKEASRVVLSSENAAADFAGFYPAQQGKAEVLPFATTPFDLPENDDALVDAPERFFLICNQFWKHKNHLLVFEALRILNGRNVHPVVLCTGQVDDFRDRAFAGKIHEALRENGLRDCVSVLGLVPRARQIALMRRTIAIIQPSLFEGWSTVVEDARVLGRPCLLSDLGVHREQNPPGACFFAPRSAEALADLMAEAWKNWPTGPNAAAECAARQRAEVRLVEVGQRFLEIAARVQASTHP